MNLDSEKQTVLKSLKQKAIYISKLKLDIGNLININCQERISAAK